MGFVVDFSEFDKFRRQCQSLESDFDTFLKDFLIGVAKRVLRQTKPKTPKDTGALRTAWQLGDITGRGREISVEILNPMEYATDIEYGHRIVVGQGKDKKEVGWYDGHFMLTTSIDSLQQQMPFRFERQFGDFCRKHGIG